MGLGFRFWLWVEGLGVMAEVQVLGSLRLRDYCWGLVLREGFKVKG